MPTYRELRADEADRIFEISRAEEIETEYVMTDGALELRPKALSVTGWHPVEGPRHPARIREVLANGGAAFGAFDEAERLIGLGSLDALPVGGDPAVMALDLLFVDTGHRAQGIGKTLTTMVSERARSLGARALYISATPTRNTVDAYRKMGAEVLVHPDPEKLALEPEDIHLLLTFAPTPTAV